jgi:IS30 family transposase
MRHVLRQFAIARATKEQRYIIASLYKRGVSKTEIADEIGVHKSTISRELKRNGSKTGTYNALNATIFAIECKERFANNRKFTKVIEHRVKNYITTQQWSPEQIVGYCQKHDIEMVSIERIYQYIRHDKASGGVIYKDLRHKLKHRKRPVGEDKSKIKDKISIELRPEKANNREEFGHFEMDLVIGKEHKGAIVTLTERVSKFFMCAYLPHGKSAINVAKKVTEMLLPYKNHVKSITTDNGLEFSEHKIISKKLNATVYFTHPYSSWEKGQIENMNKLLRQYIPKKQIINADNTLNLKDIQQKINNRLRKNLNFEKPVTIFYNFINQKVALAS